MLLHFAAQTQATDYNLLLQNIFLGEVKIASENLELKTKRRKYIASNEKHYGTNMFFHFAANRMSQCIRWS